MSCALVPHTMSVLGFDTESARSWSIHSGWDLHTGTLSCTWSDTEYGLYATKSLFVCAIHNRGDAWLQCTVSLSYFIFNTKGAVETMQTFGAHLCQCLHWVDEQPKHLYHSVYVSNHKERRVGLFSLLACFCWDYLLNVTWYCVEYCIYS